MNIDRRIEMCGSLQKYAFEVMQKLMQSKFHRNRLGEDDLIRYQKLQTDSFIAMKKALEEKNNAF